MKIGKLKQFFGLRMKKWFEWDLVFLGLNCISCKRLDVLTREWGVRTFRKRGAAPPSTTLSSAILLLPDTTSPPHLPISPAIVQIHQIRGPGFLASLMKQSLRRNDGGMMDKGPTAGLVQEE